MFACTAAWPFWAGALAGCLYGVVAGYRASFDALTDQYRPLWAVVLLGLFWPVSFLSALWNDLR